MKTSSKQRNGRLIQNVLKMTFLERQMIWKVWVHRKKWISHRSF